MSPLEATDVSRSGRRRQQQKKPQSYDVHKKLLTTKLPTTYAISFFLLTMLTMPTIDALEEGDSCSIKTFNGVCTPVSQCNDRIGNYISQGLIAQDDVVNCGFTPYEEIICCPTELALAMSTTTEKTATTTLIPRDLITPTTARLQDIGEVDWNASAGFLDFQQILTTQKPTAPKEPKSGLPKSPSPSRIDNIQSIGSFTTADTDRLPSRRPAWQPKHVYSGELQFEGLPQPSEIGSFRPQTQPQHMQQVRPMPQLPQHHGRMPAKPWFPVRQLPEQSLPHSNSIFSETMGPRFQQQQFPHDNPNRHSFLNLPMPMGPRQPTRSMQSMPIIDWSTQPQGQEAQHQVQQPNVEHDNGHNDDLLYQGINLIKSAPTAFPQTPQAQHQAQHTNFDPIQIVNDKLISQGINVIKAIPEIVRGPVRPTTHNGTPQKLIANPLQFNEPQDKNFAVQDIINNAVDGSDDVHDGRGFDVSDNVQDSRNTRNRERVAQRVCNTITAGLKRSITPHIINGVPANAMEYPHMAAIAYENIGGGPTAYEFRCGGSLIDTRFVLTAAHCVISAREKPIFVRLGVIDTSIPLEKTGIDKNITDINIHENYTLNSKYDDIAILKLESEVVTSQWIYPICLHLDISDPANDWEYYVSGWGIFNLKSREKPHILLKTQLSIVPLSSCNESYATASGGSNSQFAQGLLQTQLCAANTARTSDACSGDSGGPLIRVIDVSKNSYSIVGIVSAGFGCASSTPGLYTRVAAYLDYIESVVWPGQ